MEDGIKINIDNVNFNENRPGQTTKKKKTNNNKWQRLLVIGVVMFLGGAGFTIYSLIGSSESGASLNFPKIPSNENSGNVYSDLTGEVLSDSSLKDAPTYCIQTPNGTDGARPQAGLTEAGVVFEAVAEAGITRFAAIYQNPNSAVIGPIRSLRIYYLEWDTPFDCTIVHAGGSGDALAAVSNGGYKDLTENYTYMYRGTYSSRLWNNLFTTSAYLKKFSEDNGYKTSDVKGFARMTPEESERELVNNLANEKLNITEPTAKNTSEVEVKVPKINLTFGTSPAFDVNYTYDAEKNVYVRGYGNGLAHDVYECPASDLGERNPEDVCELTTVSPSVVIAMVVSEKRASDNYHEDITAIGSGDAYIFQNGSVIEGTWRKASREDQIKFSDKSGEEIKLAPGQTFVSAVPNYGSVDF